MVDTINGILPMRMIFLMPVFTRIANSLEEFWKKGVQMVAEYDNAAEWSMEFNKAAGAFG